MNKGVPPHTNKNLIYSQSQYENPNIKNLSKELKILDFL